MLKDRYAVFGSPISHSKSPRIHALFAAQTDQSIEYDAREVPAERFRQAVVTFFAEGGNGLNCTLPLKELAWEFARKRTQRAEMSKAVNTLALLQDGTILGDNTDGCGLVSDLTVNHGIAIAGTRILILGAGGATRGILLPILELLPDGVVIANRTVEKARHLAAVFAPFGKLEGCGFCELPGTRFDLIINATSASLSGELPPLPDDLLADGGVCYDLAYSNKPTAFVEWGKARHAVKALDGLGMLVEQAAEAFSLWRGVRPETQPVIDLLNKERRLV